MSLRWRYLRWGATGEEVRAALPGDQLVADADLTATRAITIRTAAAPVWPWLAQLGQGRGGFYSYDRLENLVGCDIHSADRVVPRWQSIEVGDDVRLHPKVGLVVAQVQPGRVLVLRGGVPIGSAPAPYDFTRAFVLREGLDETTRLVVRERCSYSRWWSGLLVEPVELVPQVHAYSDWRGRLVEHRHVDVRTLIEVPTSKGPFGLVHVIRDADEQCLRPNSSARHRMTPS